MAFREVQRRQVIEVVRRWQQGESRRAIARATGLSRNTVERYVRAARRLGVEQAGKAPGDEVLTQLVRLNETAPAPPAPQREVLAQHHERIAAWLQEEALQLTRIHELLGEAGVLVSYTTLRRYVRAAGLWKQARMTLHMAEWPPGEVAELDFGRLGRIVDATTGKPQTVWALVVVLPYSRHQFV